MNLAPLKIIVSTDKCKINVSSPKEDFVYEVPLNGFSLPLLFDFKNGFPIYEI